MKIKKDWDFDKYNLKSKYKDGRLNVSGTNKDGNKVISIYESTQLEQMASGQLAYYNNLFGWNRDFDKVFDGICTSEEFNKVVLEVETNQELDNYSNGIILPNVEDGMLWVENIIVAEVSSKLNYTLLACHFPLTYDKMEYKIYKVNDYDIMVLYFCNFSIKTDEKYYLGFKQLEHIFKKNNLEFLKDNFEFK